MIEQLKHRRGRMSRLASSRNVQWSAVIVTIYVYSKAQNHLNLSSLRSRIFGERTEKKDGKMFRKRKKAILTRRRHTSRWNL